MEQMELRISKFVEKFYLLFNIYIKMELFIEILSQVISFYKQISRIKLSNLILEILEVVDGYQIGKTQIYLILQPILHPSINREGNILLKEIFGL
jgi:hypothetical protein